jgi:predicted acetyltransferase
MIQGVTLVSAMDRRETIANQFQFYVHDFTELWATPQVELGEDGRFPPYPWLESYWVDPQREPLLILARDALAGFVLINRESHSGAPCDFSMAEFFVARHHRRSGVGRAAALQAIGARPGLWEIAVARRNSPALAFWRGVAAEAAPGAVDEIDQDDAHWNGMVLRLMVV